MGVTWPVRYSFLAAVAEIITLTSGVLMCLGSVSHTKVSKHIIVQTPSVARGQLPWPTGVLLPHGVIGLLVYLRDTCHTPAQRKTCIEMFCLLFNTATVKHGSQSVLIPSED